VNAVSQRTVIARTVRTRHPAVECPPVVSAHVSDQPKPPADTINYHAPLIGSAPGMFLR
jgi:hypothetical protein